MSVSTVLVYLGELLTDSDWGLKPLDPVTNADMIGIFGATAGNLLFKCPFASFEMYKFVKTEDCCIGLVAKASAVTDEIHFVEGSAILFIFHKTWSKENHYQLVGGCYIHRLMDGQIFELGLPKTDAWID